ncbi:hypothetical protein ACQP2U_25900 [Nocardia sp. CA-084685]|uniref:hypothetical protein n=1 Tax=Nocardia sp. CA-084685 TaxID=3239970 RepID=UPI003D96BA89
MTFIIRRSAVSADPTLGSIDHAVWAAAECLSGAGVEPNDIDVLINVGVYRDSNIVEPSNAALIQKELGMHLDYRVGSSRAGFSLDLRNGACGVLNALQAAGGLLENGTVERVLIVSSDAHPGGIAHAPSDFRYAAVGAALLVTKGIDEGTGFDRVHIPAPLPRAVSTHPGVAGYLDLKSMGNDGQRSITIDVADDYAELVSGAAFAAVRSYLAERRERQRVLVTNNPVPEFAATLASEFGFARTHQAATGELDGGSSGLIIGYHQLLEAGELSAGDELLLVAAGSGPIAGCVSYTVPAGGAG